MGTPLEAGVTVGDFRIEARAGVGGMGVVYRARQLSLDRVVALKVLGGALTDPTAVARFRRAAQATARLSHPHIAAVHFIGQDAEVCYLAMEYIDGRSLVEVVRALAAGEAASLDAALSAVAGHTAAVLRFDTADATTDLPTTHSPTPPLSPAAVALIADPAYQRRCVELVRDAALALHHAHEHGVVHRDVKPGNLMLDRAGAVKVIDFGIARFFEDSTLTDTGTLIGTPLYMSPEQVTGRIELTAATDIYSLGLVLIELLTLRPPITAGNREELLRRIVTKPLVSVRRANPAVPKELEAVAHTAAAKDADARYSTAAAFAADLQAWLDGKPVTAKPYQIAVGWREIQAARPIELTSPFMLLAIGTALAVVAALLLGEECLIGGTAYLIVARGLSKVDAIFGIIVLLTTSLSLSLVANWLYYGHRWGRQAAAAALTVEGIGVGYATWMLFTLGNLSRFPNIPLARYAPYLLPLVLVWLLASLLILCRRRTRQFFAFAARVRAEAAGTMPAEGHP